MGGNEIWKRRIAGAYGPKRLVSLWVQIPRAEGVVPFRTNITPDQVVGSPGVSDIYTPWGEACFRLELEIVRETLCWLGEGKHTIL